MQNQSRDWLLAASLTLGVGVIATFVVPSNKANSALLGSTTGAVIAAAILNGQEIKKQQKTKKLVADLPPLESKVNQLRQEQTELANISGQLAQRQQEYRSLQGAIANLKEQAQNLENRVATINKQNPSLKHCEQLQAKIEEFSIKSSSLEAKTKTLLSELYQLENQKRTLINLETQLQIRQAELSQTETRVQAAELKYQEILQKSATLDLVRATYDGLFNERQSLENRIKELNIAIAKLEAEKYRNQQTIENQKNEYINSLVIQQEINELKHTLIVLRKQQSEQQEVNIEKEYSIQNSELRSANLRAGVPPVEQSL